MLKTLSADGLGLSGRQSEVIELALSFGFHAMDLDMGDFANQVDAYGLAHARRLLDSARINVSHFRLPLVWDEWQEDDAQYDQGLERLAKIAELASSLGCQRCVSTVKPASDERPYHENFEFHRRRLGQISAILEPRGITMGLEFLAPAALRKSKAFQFIHTFDDLVQLAKASASDHVGVVVDLWHLHVSGGTLEPLAGFDPNRIVAVYLSDIPADVNIEEVTEDCRELPGQTGVIDCSAALTTLAEMGYDGPVAARVKRGSLHGKKRDGIVRTVRDRFTEIWAAAGLEPARSLPARATS